MLRLRLRFSHGSKEQNQNQVDGYIDTIEKEWLNAKKISQF